MKLLQSPLILPEAKSGAYEITHRRHETGDKLPLVTMRQAILTGKRSQEITLAEPLVVHQLYGPSGGDGTRGLLMSDSPNELVMMADFVNTARGHVLIGGLGLSLVARLAAARPQVKSVTVVEISDDVIQLTGQDLGPKVTVVNADLFQYLRDLSGWKFDRAFFDIWYPTSERVWVDLVAPLRRIVRNRFGARSVRSWAEPEMIGQMVRSLAHGSDRPLTACNWSPAHYAFRKATIWKYPAIEPKDNAEALQRALKSERLLETDPFFKHMVAVFLTQIGSRAWERTFGVHWNEHETRERKTA
jgi:hypothetical protein